MVVCTIQLYFMGQHWTAIVHSELWKLLHLLFGPISVENWIKCDVISVSAQASVPKHERASEFVFNVPF